MLVVVQKDDSVYWTGTFYSVLALTKMTFTTIYTFYISFTKYYMDMAYGHTLTAKSLFR